MSTKATAKRKAEDFAESYRTDIRLGRQPATGGAAPPTPLPKLRDAMAAFLAWAKVNHQARPSTAERYRYSSAPLLRLLKNVTIDKISAGDVERYKVARACESATVRGKSKRKTTGVPVRPATVNREVTALGAMFTFWAKDHRGLENPVRGVKLLREENQQERVLDFTEERQYLSKASDQLRDVAGLMLETGMRPGEIYHLQAPEVHLEAGFLKVAHGKTPSARRRIELTPEAIRILRARVATAESKGTQLLFHSEDDPQKPLSGVQSAHERALEQSGVAVFRLYDLRHTFATRAAESGMDQNTLASLLGHSKLTMISRYVHPTQPHKAESMVKLTRHKEEQIAKEKEQEAASAPTPKLHLVRKAG